MSCELILSANESEIEWLHDIVLSMGLSVRLHREVHSTVGLFWIDGANTFRIHQYPRSITLDRVQSLQGYDTVTVYGLADWIEESSRRAGGRNEETRARAVPEVTDTQRTRGEDSVPHVWRRDEFRAVPISQPSQGDIELPVLEEQVRGSQLSTIRWSSSEAFTDSRPATGRPTRNNPFADFEVTREGTDSSS